MAHASSGEASRGNEEPPEVGTMGEMGSRGMCDTFLCRSSHPAVAFFHLAFKATALVLYLFQRAIGLDFVSTFIYCVLLLAFDFWTVKNVSGRLLVRLRWWSRLREDGSNEWIFEGAPEGSGQVNAMDSRIFWTALFVAPLVWVALGVISLIGLQFEWFLLCFCGASLQGANVYGYVRCSREAQAQLQTAVTQGTISAISRGLGGNSATAIAAAGASAGVVGSLFGTQSSTQGSQSSTVKTRSAGGAARRAGATATSSGLTGRADGLDEEDANPFDELEHPKSPRKAQVDDSNPFEDGPVV